MPPKRLLILSTYGDRVGKAHKAPRNRLLILSLYNDRVGEGGLSPLWRSGDEKPSNVPPNRLLVLSPL